MARLKLAVESFGRQVDRYTRAILVMRPHQRLTSTARARSAPAPLSSPLCLALLLGVAAEAFGTEKPAAAGAKPAVVIIADALEGTPDGTTRAKGRVRLGQESLRLDTPDLLYDARTGMIHATGGGVRWARGRDLLQGDSGDFDTNRSSGQILSPRFFFGASLAGGSGTLIRILDADRLELSNARLTSCLADESGRPLREAGSRPGQRRVPPARAPLPNDPQKAISALEGADDLPPPPKAEETPGWELRSPRILVDFAREEGVAENAQVRFLGVPLLALPRLSFPLGDARRSGWLSPTARVDTRSGLELSVPYYLNLAPNRDATVTPIMATRRGPSVELEFRHLEPSHAGQFQVHHVPMDRQAERSRSAVYWQQQWSTGPVTLKTQGLWVSDDDYWKDFPHTQTFQRQAFSVTDATGSLSADRSQVTLQPRLLPQAASAERLWHWRGLTGVAYARVQHWQPLQGIDAGGAFISPYQRSPQLGWSALGQGWMGMDMSVEMEFNRFTRPPVSLEIAPLLRNGQRWHALASVSRPWIGPAGWLVPKLTLNSAVYRLDGDSGPTLDSASRTIPSLSVDAGLNLERPWLFGARALTQTLEPRVVYVNTPMRDQRLLPNFDSAAKEFNSTSIFSENAFSGVDRVSDAHQMTMGLTTRSIEQRSGAELLRGSIAQRFQFRDQTTTPAGGVANQRVSDLLFAATIALNPRWSVDSTVQYSPDLSRTTRSVLSMRYQPHPDTAVLAAYRYARDLAETLEMRANWPLWRRTSGAGSNDCTLLVTGATRLNYNTRDGRLADSLAGLEVDAGCWVMRMGVQRQSTGLSEMVTRLIFQVELSGLTRSRTSPLRF